MNKKMGSEVTLGWFGITYYAVASISPIVASILLQASGLHYTNLRHFQIFCCLLGNGELIMLIVHRFTQQPSAVSLETAGKKPVINKLSKITINKLSWMLYSGCLCGFAVLMWSFLAIIFGAPLTEQATETATFGLMMMVLTVLPAITFIGPYPKEWYHLFVLKSKSCTLLGELVYHRLLTVIVGAWLGAFVIPLDWDRPWQVWPIPCIFGAQVGSVVGSLYNIGLCLWCMPDTITNKKGR